jgi:hypothetical protein
MKNKDYNGAERRAYFRVNYPSTERPILRIGKNEFEVIDISERGLRFWNNQNIKLPEWARGTIIFHNNNSLNVEGKIVWEYENGIGVKLITSIPYTRILEEQRYLINLIS